MCIYFAAIRRKENGWYDEDHPLVFLFLGSSGIGEWPIKMILLVCYTNALTKSQSFNDLLSITSECWLFYFIVKSWVISQFDSKIRYFWLSNRATSVEWFFCFSGKTELAKQVAKYLHKDVKKVNVNFLWVHAVFNIQEKHYFMMEQIYLKYV